MAKLVYALNQSLDGYVDHMAFEPDATLFHHFIGDIRSLSGSIYGRRMYETMRYWDEEHDDWDAAMRDYADAWRNHQKWVVSRSMEAVGPNAKLITDDVKAAVSALKAEREGVIEVSGPELAASLGDWGLVDEYRLYVHPVRLGEGKPYFASSPPPLRLIANEQIGENVVRLTYAPA